MPTQRTPLILTAALALVAVAPARGQEQPQQQPDNIITALEKAGNHATFLQAIRAAGLEETLKGEGPYTVFAPTDEAFAKVPNEKLDALMANKDEIKELISYHIVKGAIKAADVTEPRTAETLQSASIQIVKEGEALKIQAPAPAAEVTASAQRPAGLTANVVKADLAASNGVIHAVDIVLMNEG
jgi:uncharacterized surface protein with fasciclin (FAS1) repeats